MMTVLASTENTFAFGELICFVNRLRSFHYCCIIQAKAIIIVRFGDKQFGFLPQYFLATVFNSSSFGLCVVIDSFLLLA
ncbi:hypothetical protein H6P81_007877 [Aristolochia fimbriata]|uniref:Uncharacterized protein n=1 Tax=Aristolochia fimbriata TaxID=158543 RepID=A0AAV7F1P5_ARIFI|nr:hypothetical protein H6P81_007877 [Aristolochia fimbriata]